MADLEIRAFGKRFLVIFDQHKPSEPSEPGNSGGSFEPAAGNDTWREDDVQASAFGFRVK